MADWNPISACGAKAVLADSDPDIKAAYLLTMNMWHAETVAIIEQGLASGEFRSAEPAADIARRFIARCAASTGFMRWTRRPRMRRRLAAM